MDVVEYSLQWCVHSWLSWLGYACEDTFEHVTKTRLTIIRHCERRDLDSRAIRKIERSLRRVNCARSPLCCRRRRRHSLRRDSENRGNYKGQQHDAKAGAGRRVGVPTIQPSSPAYNTPRAAQRRWLFIGRKATTTFMIGRRRSSRVIPPSFSPGGPGVRSNRANALAREDSTLPQGTKTGLGVGSGQRPVRQRSDKCLRSC